MSWGGLRDAIITRYTSDVGSGGLFESGAPLLAAAYGDIADLKAQPSYLVIESVDPFEEQSSAAELSVRHDFQVSLFLDRRGLTGAQMDTATDRAISRIRKWTPTVAGYKTNAIFYEATPVTVEVIQDVVQVVHEFYTHLSALSA